MKTHPKKLTNDYVTIALITPYWRPGEDYVEQIISALRDKLKDGDIVTVSEKAISTATGNIIDESRVRPSRLASFLARYWMRLAWGYVLGPVCHLRKKTIRRFETYPIEEGARHKQVALRLCGFLQALMHGSEGAVDGSNLPYSYVSLPLKNAQEVADRIQQRIKKELRRETPVMITDTDKTYTFHNFHFTPRPRPIKGIQSHGGFFAYLLGRLLRLEKRSTPVVVSGSEIGVEEALQTAEAANRARGYGAGRNVWDMAEALRVSLTEATWDMLDSVEHKPVVILRRMGEKTH